MLCFICICLYPNSWQSLSGNANINQCSFSNVHSPSQNGGVILFSGSTLEIGFSSFLSCSGSVGGVLFCTSTNFSLYENYFNNCSSTSHNGVSFVQSKYLNLLCNSVSYCKSDTYHMMNLNSQSSSAFRNYNHSFTKSGANDIVLKCDQRVLNKYWMISNVINKEIGGLIYINAGEHYMEYIKIVDCVFGSQEGLIVQNSHSVVTGSFFYIWNCSKVNYKVNYNTGGVLNVNNSIVEYPQYLNADYSYNIHSTGSYYFNTFDCSDNNKYQETYGYNTINIHQYFLILILL